MLRFFEPEMESRRPFSAAPADFQPFPMLQFPSWGMQQNPVSTSSLLTSVFVGNDESRATSSNAAAEVDRFFDGGVFINAENCGSFGTFSPPPPPPPPHVSTNPLNCIPGMGDAQTPPKPRSSRTPGKTSVQHNIKTLAVADTAMENETMKREAKRQKTTPCLENPQRLQFDEPAASQTPVKRSQKLGDKITALQQLVSPFGKTDTASVLHEARIYIKILHEQIQMLSNPYIGIKSPAIIQGHGGDRLGLRQRGLCLSPISPAIINLINQTPLNRCTLERITRGPSVRLH